MLKQPSLISQKFLLRSVARPGVISKFPATLSQPASLALLTQRHHSIDPPIHFRKNINSRIPNPADPTSNFEDYLMPHAVWSEEEVQSCRVTHIEPKDRTDKAAYYTVRTLRFFWDLFSGYTFGHKLGWIPMTRNMWLIRLVYLESVAGVPGMVFSFARHLKSLRQLKRDYGWINSLLSEAENERIHLLTFMNLYQPNRPFRYLVLLGQGIMSNFFFLSYLIHPRFCHRLVGYIEEEAVVTYSSLIKEIEAGALPEFREPGSASQLAKSYWNMSDDASWLDVIEQIRSDEAHHRDVNHTLAPLSEKNGPESANPFRNVDAQH